MYLMRVALIATVTFGLAGCQNNVRLARLSANITDSAAPLLSRDCIPCGDDEQTCCDIAHRCIFNDQGEVACISQGMPILNATINNIVSASLSEIVRNTFQTAATTESTIEWLSSSTSSVVTTSMETTRTSGARAAVSVSSFEDITTTRPPTEPSTPLETITVDQSRENAPSSVDMHYWCSDQISTCPVLCGGEPMANECYDPQDLNTYNPMEFEVVCICADGSVPDRSQYVHTLEDNICEQERDDCINELLSSVTFSQQDQDACFEKTCGETEIRPPPFNTTTTSDTANIKPDTIITAQNTTITIPYISYDPTSYRASIVAAEATTTILKLQCNHNDPDIDCHDEAPTMTLTVAPSSWTLYGARAEAYASLKKCSWSGSSNTTCVETMLVAPTNDISFYSSAETSIVMLMGNASDPSVMPISGTAGAYKLAQATASRLGGDGTVIESGTSAGSGTSIIVDGSSPKRSAGVSVEVSVSTALVTLMLILVLAL
ncbi:hypothetical protein DOTSEDRAFT_23044 [Dothistroma septosporum NZE10]|uniref:DUF7707 domain-containing protein n=1 Tax=Dothistroma septosporum (strain NZE10 / CBS 128990) TaxID=675120 RepID=N1PND8_DOTSN|nr:hypothetical protein DOTSEDRAFT_23044 [Dothistroma septosporum NZE10]